MQGPHPMYMSYESPEQNTGSTSNRAWLYGSFQCHKDCDYTPHPHPNPAILNVVRQNDFFPSSDQRPVQTESYIFILLFYMETTQLTVHARREESSQTNVILQYKLLAAILSAVCSVIQQSQYVLHIYYTLYYGKYDCKIAMHQTIFQLMFFVLRNNHQYNCNIRKSFLSVLHGYFGCAHAFIIILKLTRFVHSFILLGDLKTCDCSVT